ncbi:MAG: ClpXP protease specificity-enhancing factor SspB [Hyphomicrobiaceae bacterium]
MTSGPLIDYVALTREVWYGLVRTVLSRIAKSGLPGDHHFFISFRTGAPGVALSKRLRQQYPDEMTIVLQHRFWDLVVGDDRFEVKLTFDGIPERLAIPYAAIRVFLDPSVPFVLPLEALLAQEQTGAPTLDPATAPAVPGEAKGGRAPGERRIDGPKRAPEKPARPRGGNTNERAPLRERLKSKDEDATTEVPGDAPPPASAPKDAKPEAAPTAGASARPRRKADSAAETPAEAGRKAPEPEPSKEAADHKEAADDSADATEQRPSAEVVSLDAFRKKS